MGELEDLKKELAGINAKKMNDLEVAKLKKQIKEASTTTKSKSKKKAGTIKKFFSPRGNEKEVLDFLKGF